jgi:hypothetical protein
MIKQREKIIAYIDGILIDTEKLQFEEELKKNSELQNEVEKTRKLLTELKSAAEPSVDEMYFVNILPQFYLNQSKNKRFIFSKIAYSLSTVVAVSIILFFIFKPGSSLDYSSLSEISKNLTSQELNETLEQYSDEYSMDDLLSNIPTGTDSLVNNMVAKELDLPNSSINNSIADQYINTDDLLSSLNDREVNELYSRLVNEDFINGEK